mmetsp:Transcript_32167/g.80551  ORF Transcript_32167/g.80551 Transcript_32167/m.80551 type:complete len:240 (-) Transcript_32167:287-1006(-)
MLHRAHADVVALQGGAQKVGVASSVQVRAEVRLAVGAPQDLLRRLIHRLVVADADASRQLRRLARHERHVVLKRAVVPLLVLRLQPVGEQAHATLLLLRRHLLLVEVIHVRQVALVLAVQLVIGAAGHAHKVAPLARKRRPHAHHGELSGVQPDASHREGLVHRLLVVARPGKVVHLAARQGEVALFRGGGGGRVGRLARRRARRDAHPGRGAPTPRGRSQEAGREAGGWREAMHRRPL